MLRDGLTTLTIDEASLIALGTAAAPIKAAADLCRCGGVSTTPQIEVITNTICNLDTNTWQYITTVYIDGVAQTPDTVDTGTSCDEPQPFPPQIETIQVCDPVTNTIHEQVWKYTIDPVTNLTASEQIGDVDTLLACAIEEVDLVYTAPVQVCYDNVGVLTQYAVRERIEYNNTTLTEVTRVTEYSSDGAAWTTVAPVGVATVGACPTICLSTPLGLLTNWG